MRGQAEVPHLSRSQGWASLRRALLENVASRQSGPKSLICDSISEKPPWRHGSARLWSGSSRAAPERAQRLARLETARE